LSLLCLHSPSSSPSPSPVAVS
ncbi:hypothetical protein Zm00014a_027801, partial [Zea mays]